jgi:hypothetical protein
MLRSSTEDFSKSTLAAVPGTIGKLQYVAGLRTGDDYVHWGMARSHGEENASVTIAQAHSDLFSSVLHAPISGLWDEVQDLAGREQQDVFQFVEDLLAQKNLLIPVELRGGSQRHFNSVLLALCRLAASLESRTGRAA